MLSLAYATIDRVSRREVHGDGPPKDVASAAMEARLGSAAVMPGQRPADERVGSKIDDASLVGETLAGKRWAQREVWYRFAPMVYGLLRRALGSRHEHDDLVQEVFLRVFRRLHTLENHAALRSFVYSVAVRVVSEEIRHFYVLQRAREQLVVFADPGEPRGTDFESRDTLMRVQRILDGMKDKHRAVFVLRHVEGMELQDIANGLDISLATVKRHLVKAVRNLQQAVAKDEGLRQSLAGLLDGKTLGGNA